MTAKAIKRLQKGDKIQHRYLGVCTVKKVVYTIAAKSDLFGLLISPDEGRVRSILRIFTQRDMPFMETNYREVKMLANE